MQFQHDVWKKAICWIHFATDLRLFQVNRRINQCDDSGRLTYALPVEEKTMAPKVDISPKVLTDEEWHETNIKVYLLTESGPGKSDVWNWGEGFPDARARWIAVEVDLFMERMGMKDKQRAYPATVKVISYWEKGDKEQVESRGQVGDR